MEEIIKEQEFTARFDEKKKRFRMNLIEFIIWLILLSFAFNYLKNHPAERTSMFAGIEVLFQRAEIFITNITGDDGGILEEKHQLERYYKELISTMENGKCADLATIDAANERYKDLINLNIDEYKQNIQVYQWYAGTYAAKIKENCSE